MDRFELQNYIEKSIPIVKEMGFIVETVEDKVQVSGKYQKHVNHTKSVFGGSLSSIMTLGGWTKVNVLLGQLGYKGTVVIKGSSIDYLLPVVKDYIVTAEEISEKDIKKFEKTYNKFGKGRLFIKAFLTHRESHKVLATFQGEFVVLKKKS